jgi:hypothetical protein
MSTRSKTKKKDYEMPPSLGAEDQGDRDSPEAIEARRLVQEEELRAANDARDRDEAGGSPLLYISPLSPLEERHPIQISSRSFFYFCKCHGN